MEAGSFERDQAAIAAALTGGPDHCPDALFVGGRAAMLRGLAVHANSISYARLVALEDSFPHCRTYLGAAAFNQLSRVFVEGGGGARHSASSMGADFPAWIADRADRRAAEIAAIEWAWLQSYHAADAPALALCDLAALDPAGLLALRVRRHPAARALMLSTDAGAHVDAALSPGCRALLVTRPDAAVLLSPVDPIAATTLAAADLFQPIGNLIEHLAEPEGNIIAALIGAGALEMERT